MIDVARIVEQGKHIIVYLLLQPARYTSRQYLLTKDHLRSITQQVLLSQCRLLLTITPHNAV